MTNDPFYSESNFAHLRRGVAALNNGQGVVHDPIPLDTRTLARAFAGYPDTGDVEADFPRANEPSRAATFE